MIRNETRSSRLVRLVMVILLGVTPLLSGCVTATMHREKGQAAQARGDFSRAIEQYQAALEKNPADHRARFHLGEAYLAIGENLKAQLAFEKVMAGRPADELLVPRVLDKLAEAIYRQNRADALYDMLESSVEAYPSSRSYLRQADYLVKLGDHDLAAVAYQKAGRFSEPGDATAYLRAAGFYDSIGDPANTALNLRYAMYVDPDHPKIAPWFRKLGIVPGPTLPLQPPALTNVTP
ncbi:MAG: tetratricopeptide repeat protein [Phycisphaeraceae bacterium]